MSETNRPGWNKPLDESLYPTDEQGIAFMKATTGIEDDEELKKHILAVQAKAFGVGVAADIRGVPSRLNNACSCTDTRASGCSSS